MRQPEIINAIGGTPLLPIERLASHVPDGVTVLAKAEFMNPGGSVKDRPAWAMIREGLKSGQLNAQTTLLDATSGNTGIAYAMIGAAVGFRVHLAIPENASQPRQRLLGALGAELFLTDPVEGTDGAQMHVRRLIERNRDRYFYPDQYNNDANWLSHFETTGAEIIEQTEGKVTHFVAALGTTGTLIGVSRRLKQDLTNAHPTVQSIAVQPDTALHGIEGVKHIPSAIVPGIYDPDLQDGIVEVSTEEAIETARLLAREEGLFVGPSSGANVAAALKIAETLDRGVVVTILCDSGERY